MILDDDSDILWDIMSLIKNVVVVVSGVVSLTYNIIFNARSYNNACLRYIHVCIEIIIGGLLRGFS